MTSNDTDRQLQRFSAAVAHAAADLRPLDDPSPSTAGRRPVLAAVVGFAAMLLLVGVTSVALVMSRAHDAPSVSIAGASFDNHADEGYVGGQCMPTIPTEGFVPPEPYAPSRTDGLVWYGTNEIWTALDENGEHSPRKSVWWSENFPGGQVEESPAILVEWTRLDADAPTITNRSEGTNASTTGDGWFMIGGIDPDVGGCWRVAATYKGTSLSYVYERS